MWEGWIAREKSAFLFYNKINVQGVWEGGLWGGGSGGLALRLDLMGVLPCL